MIASLFASLLQAAAPPSAAGAAMTPAAPPPAASASASASADEDAPTAEGLESLRQSYHDSCEVRLYGQYDEMCSALADQVRRYGVALAKAERTARVR